MKIRKANEKDKEMLNYLFQKLLEYERYNYDGNIKIDLKIDSFFDKKISDMNYIIYVALVNKNIVGYICGSIDYDNKIKTNNEVYINSLYVVDNFRNKGIGKNLLIKLIDECKEKNIYSINIDNFVNNDRAKYLYNKLKFKIVKESRSLVIGKDDV